MAPAHVEKLRDILAALDLSREPDDMNLPGFRLHGPKWLGITRQALSELVNEHTGIFLEAAIRLSKAFGSTPETWLGMQMVYDLWQARDRSGQITVERFVAA